MYSYSGSGESEYSLNVNLSTPDQYEINDSVASARGVLVDSSSFGTIDNIKDVDYFRVEIEETENYVFELQNIPSGKDYDLSIYDSSGNAVAYSWNSSNNDELINMSLNPGCYYIKIHSYSGFSDEQNYMVSVYKENALTLSMPYIRANAGDTISVPVAIQNLPTEGLCAFDFLLDYDSTMLNYLDYTVDCSDPSWALVDTEQVIEVNKESDGVIRVLFLDNSTTFTKPLNKEGIIIKLNFQVNTEATDGVYDISCGYGSFAKCLGDTVLGVSHAIFKNGLIMIGSYGLTGLQFDAHIQNLVPMATKITEVGDINGDGYINSIDFAMLRMYLLGLPTNSFNEVIANLNGQGDVNSLNFALFRQYLLGFKVAFYGIILYKRGYINGKINIPPTYVNMYLGDGWSLFPFVSDNGLNFIANLEVGMKDLVLDSNGKILQVKPTVDNSTIGYGYDLTQDPLGTRIKTATNISNEKALEYLMKVSDDFAKNNYRFNRYYH